MEIGSFVKGMAWHDIAKPLLLANDKHARLGYLLLEALGHPQEALVALAHPSFKGGRCILADHLMDYLQRTDTPNELSPILALEHVLDRLAAASYSLMSDALPEKTQLHSFLNPFSRLPLVTDEFDPSPFVATLNTNSGAGYPHLATVFQEQISDVLAGDENTQRQFHEAVLRSSRYEQAGNDLSLIPGSYEGQIRVEIFSRLMEFSNNFPERTYHPVNDTSLSSHTRLSAILAHVLYHNLEQQSGGFLDQSIKLHDEQVQIGEVTLKEFIDRGAPGDPDRKDWSGAQDTVRQSLDGVVVRVAFDSYRDIYEAAVRLDDLTGTRVLVDRVRTSFKSALARVLGVPDLADYLWLSESLFELVYFLPASFSSQVESILRTAYSGACEEVIDSPTSGLLALLADDFSTENSIDFTQRRDDLFQQLQMLQPGWGVAALPTSSIPANDFDHFASLYGQSMLDAYQRTQASISQTPQAISDGVVFLSGLDSVDADMVCQICNAAPVDLSFFERLNSSAPEDAIFRKATHLFRGEPEQLCISCIARRILSHAERSSPELTDMLHLEPASGHVWAEELNYENAPALPPGLVREAICAPGDFLDMGAAYIRRNKRDTSELDVFPTIGYTADIDSNVALLSLRATDALFSTYHYEALPDLLDGRDAENNIAHRYLQDIVVGFHDSVENHLHRQGRDVALAGETLQAVPHAARVLQRIEFLNQFFGVLPGYLAGAGIRTLALDWEYPHVRLLVPATQLDRALEALVQAVDTHLFSFPLSTTEDDRGFASWVHVPDEDIMSALLPPLLRGSVVVFKQRQALYLVLEGERELLQRPVADGWYGFHLYLADMRGSLSASAEPQAEVTYGHLPEYLSLVQKIDRRTIMSAGVAWGQGDLQQETRRKLVGAQLAIRSDWTRLGRQDLRTLADENAFAPVHFIKRVMKS